MKTVLVGGCFDILHFGHISFLTQAKALGDTLIVALESDNNVRKSKGPLRPIHSQENRKTMLKALSCVSEVISLQEMHGDQDYIDFVTRTKPSVIAVTEGDPIADKKRKQAETIGAEFVIIPKIRTPSTSQLTKLLGLE